MVQVLNQSVSVQSRAETASSGLPSSTISPADRMIYFVQVDYGFRIGTTWVERDPGRMDRSSTLEDITRGEWGSNVAIVKVIECNPFEHICSDVTEEFVLNAQDARLEAAE